MSEFVAGAFVDVRPDTRGFADALKKQLNSEIKKAGTFKVPVEVEARKLKASIQAQARGLQVDVNVEAKGLRTSLQRQMRDAKITVPVDVNTTKLKATLAQVRDARIKVSVDVDTAKVKAALSQATRDAKIKVTVDSDFKNMKSQAEAQARGAKIQIPVVPNMADFKKKLDEGIKQATRGMKVQVPVEPVKGRVQGKPLEVDATVTPKIDPKKKVKVPVSADPVFNQSEFRKALSAKIAKASEGVKAKVGAEPAFSIIEFRKALQKKVDQAAAEVTARVKAEPTINISAFRAQLQKKIKQAAEGMKILVPVEPTSKERRQARRDVQTTPAAPATPPGQIPLPGLQRDTQAQLAGEESAIRSVTEEKKKLTKETKELTEAEKQELAVTKALESSKKSEALAERLKTQATVGGISAEERAARLGEARAAATRSIKSANEQLAVSSKSLTAEQRSALEAQLASAQAARQDIIQKQKAAKISAEQTDATEKSKKAQQSAARELLKQVDSFKTLNPLHQHENELLRVEARLKREAARATELGLDDIARENRLILNGIDARKKDIAARRDQIKGETTFARQQKTAARGFGATVLSLLGIRGATLAANASFLAGAAASAVFAKSLASFAELETELAVFQATANATAEEMKDVAKAAHDLGVDVRLPGVSAGDAAQAMSELSRAGLSVRDAIAGARGVLELAAAAQISNAEAAQLAASALNAFGLAGDQSIRVADLLANAANNSQGSITEMGAALQQASAIARQVGFSLEDTVTTLTIFARNGLRGSDAGTSLRTALSRLVAPTKQASELIAALNLNLRDAQGNLRPDIFVQFGEATQNLSPALRDMIAQTIAGQDAIRAFSIGAREGADGLRLAQLQMEQTGAAAELAAARSQGLSGAFRALGSTVETLGVQMGNLVAGPIQDAVGGLTEIVETLNFIATGDFSGLFGEFAEDTKKWDAGLRQTGKSLKDIVAGGLFGDSDQFLGGLRDLTDRGLFEAPKVEKDIDRLREQLAALNELRVQKFELNLPIGGITRDIKEVQRRLRDAKIETGEIIPLTETQKAIQEVQRTLKAAVSAKVELGVDTPANERTIKELKERLEDAGEIRVELRTLRGEERRLRLAGADTSAVERDIRNLRKKLIATLRGTSADIEKELTGTGIAKSFKTQFDLIADMPDLATPEVLGGLSELARKIRGVAPLTGAAGREVGKSLLDSITAAIQAAVEDDNPELAEALKKYANQIANLFGVELGTAFKNIKVPLTSGELTEALLPQRLAVARAEAFGSVSEIIAAKQDELTALKRQLGQVVKGSEEEESVLNQITAKQNEIRSLRESQASEEKEKNRATDQKVLDAISGAERKRQNRLQIAETTETLADDLRAQVALRNFYRQQVEEVQRTVRDAEARRDKINELNESLFEIDLDIAETQRGLRNQRREARLGVFDEAAENAEITETLADDLRIANRRVSFWRKQVEILKDLVKKRRATADELKQAQDDLDEAEDAAAEIRRDRRQQQRENRQERLELRIQIAQDTGNLRAEVAAREAQIKNTQKLIRATRRGSLARLRLIAELRRQQRELRELRAEKKKANDEAKKMFFEFLQTQQGFAANLIGNLIPGGRTTGLVGGQPAFTTGLGGANRSTPSATETGLPGARGFGGGLAQSLIKERTSSAAGQVRGFTAGQGNATNQLLRSILIELRKGNRESEHPEAKQQRKTGATALDYGGGTSMGM